MIDVHCPVTLREKGFTLQLECANDENYLRAYFIAENLPVVEGLPWDDMQKKCLLAQQFELQHQSYARQFSDCAPLVLKKADTPVGRLYLALDAVGLHIVDILLAKNWRGHGIGTALLRGVQECAFDHQLPVILSVDRLSAYSGFYRKLGFEICRSDDILWTMRWPPVAATLNARYSMADDHGFRPRSRYADFDPARVPHRPDQEYENDPVQKARNKGF